MKIGQIRILFILLVALAFFKIYQHNLIVKLTYEHQRLLRHKKSLEQQRNELYIAILKLRDPEKIFADAQEKLGMQPLTIAHIKMVPSVACPVDCLHTTSHATVLNALGLLDVTVRGTKGCGYVRT